MLNRVSFYIDGYNLYHGIRDAYGHKYLWLNLADLCASVLREDQALATVHFCTARIRGYDQDKWRRQDLYWRALGSCPAVQIHEGFYQRNRKWCSGCKGHVYRHEEKQTDSRIAALMVADALTDRTDTLVLIGGDSDHVPPVEIVKADAPGKDLLVCWPPRRVSDELRKAVGKHLHISEARLRQNQFPDRLKLSDGSELLRPAKWGGPPE